MEIAIGGQRLQANTIALMYCTSISGPYEVENQEQNDLITSTSTMNHSIWLDLNQINVYHP